MAHWFQRRSENSVLDEMHQQHELIAALDADVDRQLGAAEVATSGMATRASILIAAAGLTSGLQISAISVIPALLSVLAALVGVALLMMRTADEVPILEAETTFWVSAPTEARRNLMHWKNGILEERERSLRSRRRVLIIGFGLLAGSISYELGISLIEFLSTGGD